MLLVPSVVRSIGDRQWYRARSAAFLFYLPRQRSRESTESRLCSMFQVDRERERCNVIRHRGTPPLPMSMLYRGGWKTVTAKSPVHFTSSCFPWLGNGSRVATESERGKKRGE